MDMVMELNHNTEYAIMNSNDRENKPPNVVFVKLEAPEAEDAQLKLLVHEVHTVKRENVSNEDKFESTSLKADPHVFSNQSLKLKLETPPQDCWLGSDQKISVKQELFDEELEIKSEDEIIQENHVDDIKHPSGIKPFKCNICDKHFRLKDLLKRHLRTHTSQKPFKCNMCEYSCGRKATLKIHLMTHTGEKPFKCQICDYSCGQSANLRSHLRTHTGEKPFKCTVCGYRCRQNSTLKIHLRTHTGERPIKCSVCDYSCVHNFALKRHLRTHTGEKPYKCTVCDYSAAQSGDMKRHLITHTGLKTFKCNICEYRCARKSNLRIHLQHSHKS